MAVTIQTRRDDSTDWSTANPVLALGEIGIETDTDKAKYGDGFTAWNDLPYWIDEGAQIPDGTVQGQTLRYNLTDDGWQATSDLIVDDAGNVGIGTPSPVGQLTVSGNQNAVINSIRLTNEGGFADNGNKISWSSGANTEEAAIIAAVREGAGLGFAQTFSTSPNFTATEATERMRLDSSGNLLVGTTTAVGVGVTVRNNFGYGQVLNNKSISGNFASLANYHNGTYVGGVSYSDTASSFPTTSDERLKKNIEDSAKSLGAIGAMQVRQFDWRSDDSHQDFGFIAQELVNVAPFAVMHNEEDDVWGVDNSKLVPVLVKAIQEQQAQIDELRRLING